VFGIASQGWRVLSCSSEQAPGEAAALAFDGDPATRWHSRWSPDSPGPPHHLAIDLGRTITLAGFGYLPRGDLTNGTIADYEFQASPDGEHWITVAAATFGNVKQNPVVQIVRLGQPMPGVRCVQLIARREVEGRAWASCAELAVFVR
jgi:hexosaminidase